MLVCTAQLTSFTPYSCSRKIDDEDKPKSMSPTEWDRNVWQDKATYTDDGIVCIPQMALKMAVDEAVKRLDIKIEGRGKSTYTKYFLAGHLCEANVPLGITRKDLEYIDIWVNSDGVRGSGKRVKRRFPIIQSWSGVARFAILDPIIPKHVFENALINAGKLIGIGRFRPERGGFLGRFAVTKVAWSEN